MHIEILYLVIPIIFLLWFLWNFQAHIKHNFGRLTILDLARKNRYAEAITENNLSKITPLRFMVAFVIATLMAFCTFKAMFNLSETPRYNLSEEYAKIFETPLNLVGVTHYYYGHGRLSMDVEAKSGNIVFKQQGAFHILKPTARTPEVCPEIISFLLGSPPTPYKIEPWVKKIFYRPLYDLNDVSPDPKDIEKSWGIWICMDAAQTRAHVYCNNTSMLSGKP